MRVDLYGDIEGCDRNFGNEQMVRVTNLTARSRKRFSYISFLCQILFNTKDITTGDREIVNPARTHARMSALDPIKS